jgi:DNA-binding transcriptional MocR family regulator
VPVPQAPTRPPGRIRLLDHVAIVVEAGTLADYADFCTEAFGLSRYSSEYTQVGDQAIDSIVVRSSSGGITFTILEQDPRKKAGQIEGFLYRNGGPGVQHLAFLADDIILAVREFSDRGIDFLHTPRSYYDMLADRLPGIRGEIADLRATNVLADQDGLGYLLQLFTRSPYKRNTLFYELVHRRGARGFGGANIKALYEAVERDGLAAGEFANVDAPSTIPGNPLSPEPAVGHGVSLRREDLHASVSDPLLDTMNFLNEVTSRYPEAISFAPGRPYDGFFDTEQIFTHVRSYLDHLADSGNSPGQIRDAVFQYGPTAGRIRELIAGSLRVDENIDVPPESIVVTVGCQEAIFLALRALISGPDDVLLVSSPCYVGIVGAARLLDIQPVAVEEREDGFRCADLDAAIRAEVARGRRPRAFYVVPDHSNPTGTTMPVPTRHQLIDLAARHDILVLEDSPYRMVSPGPHLPTLKSLDRRRRVVHLGSFSKTAFPGARVGFAVADQPVTDSAGRTGLLADELAKIKSMVTVNTSSLSQAAIAGMLLSCQGRISEFNVGPAAYYANAMRSVLRQLERCFPTDRRAALQLRWNEPDGGFFLTMCVPFRADNAALARSAEDFGVLWTPMSYFYPDGGGDYSIRLSVSYLSDEEITEGITRLASFIEAEAKIVPL